MTALASQAPDALLRHLAKQALSKAERAADTAERIGWLCHYAELQFRVADLANTGDDR